jgi:tetratricopeptide (TPR) repeat protein
LDQLGTTSKTLSEDWLPSLAKRELVTIRAQSRFPGEVEGTFRHALVREAAYAMLTEEDKVLGHRLAGAWLEARGERDAIALAQHFDRGGEPARAIAHYVRAAAQALDGSDLAQVIACAERGVALGAALQPRGELRRLQAEALRWRGAIAEAEAAAREAMDLLDPSTSSWCQAVGELAASAGAIAHADVVRLALDTLLAHKEVTPKGDFLATLARTLNQLHALGQSALAGELSVELDDYEPKMGPNVGARIAQARSFAALYSSDTGTYYEHLKSAQALFALAGDRRGACVQALNMAYVAATIGALDEADAALAPALETAEALGITRLRASVQQNLGFLRRLQGRLAESIDLLRQAFATFSAQGDQRLSTFSLVYLADALDARGETDAAFAEAKRALDASEVLPSAHATALVTLANLELRHGRGDPLAHSALAYHTLLELGGLEDSEALVRVVHAEALQRAGRTEEAVEVARRAVEALRARAEKISGERWRKLFLEVEENRRTFRVAEALGLGDPQP